MHLKTPVLMAQIGAPHGVKGDVRVQSFAADPMALADYGSLYNKEGQKFRIKRLRPAKNMLVVKFEGVNSRDEAQALNRQELFIDRSMLPDDTQEDEFYVTDLIDMDVRNEEGLSLGRIKTVVNFGAGDLLEIIPSSHDVAHSNGQTWFLQFTRDSVPHVDLNEAYVVICLPEEVSERDPDDA